MSTADSTIIFDSTDLVLELDQTTIDRSWSNSQTAGNSSSRWQNYLNQLALAAFLPWLQQEEDTTAQANLSSTAQSAVWSVVNGTAIALKDAKLVLVPSEAEDLEELRVAQEWLDIPSWAADYYLAVQVNIDAGYVRFWGYATHQQLKQGDFNLRDRTYSLTDDRLMSDFNALWVARQLCPDEVTQAAIAPIEELASAQADKLIERLGSQSQLLPRLAVPFSTWAGLLQNSQYLSRLAAARRGETVKTSVLQWLKKGSIELAQDMGWRQIELSLSSQGARGTATTPPIPAFGLAKQLTIANSPYELKIMPLSNTGAWRFELCCLTPGCMIPEGYRLKLLTSDLQNFEGNEELATEPVGQLAIEVDLEPKESLVWQVEPTPDNYQQEVLQF